MTQPDLPPLPAWLEGRAWAHAMPGEPVRPQPPVPARTRGAEAADDAFGIGLVLGDLA